MNNSNLPLWEKLYLTVDETAKLFGIGKNKIREISDTEDCKFVLWVGSKRLIKRKKLEKYINETYSL